MLCSAGFVEDVHGYGILDLASKSLSNSFRGLFSELGDGCDLWSRDVRL